MPKMELTTDQKRLMCVKPGVHWVETEGQAALFFHFGTRYMVEGPFVSEVLAPIWKLLQQPRTSEELLEKTPAASAEMVAQAVVALERAGFIEYVSMNDASASLAPPHHDSADASLLRFLSRFFTSRQSSGEALRKLRAVSIGIVDCGSCLTDLQQSLKSLGLNELRVVSGMGSASCTDRTILDADLIVVVANWFNIHQLKKWNQTFLRESKRWLLVTQDYFGGGIGPYFGYEDGPCLECLFSRRANQMEHFDKLGAYQAYFENHQDRLDLGFEPSTRQLCEAVAVEIIKLVVEPIRSKTPHGLYEFDHLNHRTEYHHVLPLPSCRACGPFVHRPVQLTEGEA